MKKQLHYFLTAMLFFTRIPCPQWVNHSSNKLHKSNRYFSLVGIVVGTISAFAFYMYSLVFSVDIAIVVSMIASIWITGAFHEDGLADVCDGFGGGWTKEKILLIMKDSRLGTFGVLGLINILALKFLALRELNNISNNIPLILISGHAISRFIASVLLYTHEYVRDDTTSKVKAVTKHMNLKSLLFSFFFGILPLFFFYDYCVFLTLLPLGLTYCYLGYFYNKWIGGQTGDCAGALQQVSEVIFYLSLIFIWKLF